MSRTGSYLGWNTVIRQRRRDFEEQLKNKASRAKKRAIREQAEFDKKLAEEREVIANKIREANKTTKEAAAKRRKAEQSRSGEHSPKVRRPKKEFVVERIERKLPQPIGKADKESI
jgi:hypothetical protein